MALRLRPRNAWEAMDLGLELVRVNAGALYLAWILAYVPVAAIVIAFMWETPFLAWLVLWWLKPLFDRLALAVLARRLFGDPASPLSVLRSLPALAWKSGIVGALTWRRLDFARSLHLPVYQLERLAGKAARSRIRVMDRDARGAAVWLTFLLLMTELSFGLALSLLVALMTPVQAPVNTLIEGWFMGRFEQGGGATALGALAACIVEPVYVACGFTLYVQRRTMLEGWDIELRFRQLSARIEKLRKGAAPAVACILMALAVGAGAPRPAYAADPPPRKAADEVREVLKDPVFGRKDTTTKVRWVGPRWKSESKSEPFDWSWFSKLSRLAGEAARALAWVAGGALLAVALYYLARYVRMHGHAASRRARPDFLFGLDVRPGSLPDDVAAAAEALAGEGRARDALSLLYRGALVRFMDGGIEFRQGDTEGDCMRRVEAAEAPARRTYFASLVSAWQSLAYAHRSVEAQAVTTLASGWRESFARPS